MAASTRAQLDIKLKTRRKIPYLRSLSTRTHVLFSIHYFNGQYTSQATLLWKFSWETSFYYLSERSLTREHSLRWQTLCQYMYNHFSRISEEVVFRDAKCFENNTWILKREGKSRLFSRHQFRVKNKHQVQLRYHCHSLSISTDWVYNLSFRTTHSLLYKLKMN